MEFTDKGVAVQDESGHTTVLEADTAVIALGLKGDTGLYEEIAEIMPADTYLAGGCEAPKNVFNATFKGFNVAVEL